MPRSIGSRASSSFLPGSVLTNVAHSLLAKLNERTRAMGALTHIRRRKMIAQGGRCYYCGLQMWDDAVASHSPSSDTIRPAPKVLRCTAEHLLARSDGGGDTSENIVAACLYCNTQRHRRKRPLSPDKHRIHVRARMKAGRWLAALSSGSLFRYPDGPS